MADVMSTRKLPEELIVLSSKYGVSTGQTPTRDRDHDHDPNDDDDFLQQHVSGLKKTIRAIIAREMRIKEGYENMRRVTKDRKQLDSLKRDVRLISDKIGELHSDLQTLDIYATGTVVGYYMQWLACAGRWQLCCCAFHVGQLYYPDCWHVNCCGAIALQTFSLLLIFPCPHNFFLMLVACAAGSSVRNQWPLSVSRWP
ncbi:unnamed protein product [Soboliphyme baturini]|uniref:REM-1 domain-containing protein n=1 Tax=Soboliphyme baturini TaxID=241478 RepID=A0A183IZN4_9BILA|nr:unnamed protein product [Soboliphyme baturini]